MPPLISCILPTTDRRHLLPLSIKCYQSQDWQNKELVVVDDGEDCVRDLFEGITNCRYFRAEKFKTLGEKINYCCEQARGEIIVTWDDDDWYSPTRITDQVTRLLDLGKSVTGYHSMLFWDGEMASQYRGAPNYAVGNSQVYRREFWEKHKFPAVDVGYDNELSQKAKDEDQIVCVRGEGMAVARIHGKNITGKRPIIGQGVWPYVEKETYIPPAFFNAIA